MAIVLKSQIRDMQLLFLEKGMPLFELNPSKILEYQIQSIYYPVKKRNQIRNVIFDFIMILF
jgi:hypothetical protein